MTTTSQDKQYRHPVIRTRRFNIFNHEIPRDEIGGCPRTVFQAWCHCRDIPKPLCIVTVWERMFGKDETFVEWVHVDERYRRLGIATEVIQAIKGMLPKLYMEGTTKAGRAFCKTFVDEFPSLFPNDATAGIRKTLTPRQVVKALRRATDRLEAMQRIVDELEPREVEAVARMIEAKRSGGPRG